MVKDLLGNGIKVWNGYSNTCDNKKPSYLNAVGRECSGLILTVGVISLAATTLCDAISGFRGNFKEPKISNNYRPQRR